MRSIVGYGSLILHWLVTLVLFGAICIVDFLSPYKVFATLGDKSTDALAYTLEVAILINSLWLYDLETYCYSPPWS